MAHLYSSCVSPHLGCTAATRMTDDWEANARKVNPIWRTRRATLLRQIRRIIVNQCCKIK